MLKTLTFSLIVILFLIFPKNTLAATLTLSPSNGTINRGCDVAIDVNLDTTGSNTDGTDVILKFNQSQLTVQAVDKGVAYPDYPSISPNNSAGTVLISGLASVDQPFNGSGKFATVFFTVNVNAAVSSSAQVTFDFDRANTKKTTDTNVVETGTVSEVLTSVVDGSYTIGSGSCGAITPLPSGGLPKGGPFASPSAQPDLDQITGDGTPPGSTTTTLILSVIGGILVVLGILGVALL